MSKHKIKCHGISQKLYQLPSRLQNYSCTACTLQSSDPAQPPGERVRDRTEQPRSSAADYLRAVASSPVTTIRAGFTFSPVGDSQRDWFRPDWWPCWLVSRLRYPSPLTLLSRWKKKIYDLRSAFLCGSRWRLANAFVAQSDFAKGSRGESVFSEVVYHCCMLRDYRCHMCSVCRFVG